MRLEPLKSSLLGLFQHESSSRQSRRRAVLELLCGSAAGRMLPKPLTERLLSLGAQPPERVLARLDTRLAGLYPLEASQRRRRYGRNEVAHERPLPWWRHLWHCYRNPFNLLLTVLAAVALFNDVHQAEAGREAYAGVVIIGVMVALSTLLRFAQETRSGRAAERLQAMVSNTASVLRPDADGAVELPIHELVPGDVVQLSAGDMVPADLRLLSARDLFLSQAALTGESLPVEKFAQPRQAARTPLECDTLCFMGSSVVSGSGRAVVVSTGKRSVFGLLAERVTHADPAPTAFQAGMNRVSWLLIRFMCAMAPLVLLLTGFTRGDWGEATLFALSVAVGLTPEMLPLIASATLARGALALSRQQVIVKRLDAIQNLGAMDILCTDKTGTLTQERVALERHANVFGEPEERVLRMAWLNSHHQTGLRSQLDLTVLEHGAASAACANAGRKVDEIPFDFVRRRMSVVVDDVDGQRQLVCKGALEEVLEACAHARHGERLRPLNQPLLMRIREVADELNRQGLRVVAVATRELDAGRDGYGAADEAGLVLEGYITFLDPLKDSTTAALTALRAKGVEVKIMTGDSELVTLKLCRDAGVRVKGVLLGNRVDAMSDPQLGAVAEHTTVFAKLSPLQKERLVRVLRERGHVVGFLGDGVNDAPALRAADVGISVNGAADIAREAADIILLERSLMVLERGVTEGRRTFANMLKYIKMTASSNFGNVFSVLAAGLFLPFLPMLPLQLLIQNLLYDASQLAIPFDDVDEEQLARPLAWNPNELGRFMLHFGPVSSLFDMATFALLWLVLGAASPAQQGLFQSGWFVEGLLSQTLIVHLLRTRRIPFVQSRPSWPLLATTGAVVAIGLALPWSPLAAYLGMEPLPGIYYPWLVAILLAYALLVQGMKAWYTRRYGWDGQAPRQRPRWGGMQVVR